jgi:hypothetical protein
MANPDPGEEADAEVQESKSISEKVMGRSRRVKQEEPGKGTHYLDDEDVNPKSRGCTDLICCCLFLAGIVGMVVMRSMNAQQAHVFKILYPLDHAGNSCGLGDFADYPKVYYPSKEIVHGGALTADVYYSNPMNLWSVCTKECPRAFSRYDRAGMCREQSHETSSVQQLVSTNTSGSGNVTGLNTTAAEEVVTESHPVCTWYSDLAPKLIMNQYCIFGSSYLNHQPDSTGTVCQSASRAVQDVQDEAIQSLSNMGNATKHYLDYLNQTVPEVQQDPEMTEILIKLEGDTEVRVASEKQAIRNAAVNSTEQHLVKACKEAVGHQKSAMADFVSDVMNAWAVLLWTVTMGLVTGALYLCLICYFVKPIVWGSLVLCIVGFSIAGWLFWDEAIQVADTGLPCPEEKTLAVLCWIFALVNLAIVVVARRALHLAIAISGATSSFLMKNIGVMFVPHLLSLIQIGFLFYWLVGLSGILSTAEARAADNVTEEHGRLILTGAIKLKILYHIFMGLWIHAYLEGMATVATSMTVTDWYYKPKVKGEKPSSHWSCFKDLGKAFLYHSGSVACGGLLVSIVGVIKAVLNLYERAVRNLTSETVAKYLVGGCKCCLNLVEIFLKFINYNTYIMVGISGKSFFWSAKDVWGIRTRNPKRFVVFVGVMRTLNMVGRGVIVGVMLLWGALLLNKSICPSLSENIHSPWPVLLCVVFLGWMIAGLVFGVFTTAGASLFYNFVCDEEICSFSGGDREIHAPGDLGKLLEAEMKRKKNSSKKKSKAQDESGKEPLAGADEETPAAEETTEKTPEF